MAKEIINCLILAEKEKDVKAVKEVAPSKIDKRSVVYSWQNDLNLFNVNEKLTKYDFIIVYIKESDRYSKAGEFPLATMSGHLPAIYILDGNNYRLAYELEKKFGAVSLVSDTVNPGSLTAAVRTVINKNKTNCESGLNLLKTINTLFQNSKLGFATFDRSGIMVSYNKTLQHLLGYRKNRLLAIKLEEISRPDTAVKNQEYEDFIGGSAPYFEIEKPLYNEQGSMLWCRLTFSKLEDGDQSLCIMSLYDASTDVFARRQLEQERYLLQTLMDNIPDAIYFKDVQHKFMKVSKFVHLKGIESPEEAVGKTDFDFFSKEHAQEACDDEDMIIRTGNPIINKIEKETFPNGDISWVSTTKAPLFDAEGLVTGIVGISRDVTDIKIKEDALLKSEERYRNLIEYSPDTIAVICDNKIIFTNIAGVSLMHAKDKDEILDKEIKELVHPHYSVVTEQFLNQVLNSQTVSKVTNVKLRRINGETFDVELTGIPTTFNGKPAIQLIIRDITDIRRQEKIKQTTLRILQASNYSKTTDELFKYIHHAIGNLMPVRNFYIALYDEETEMISFPYFIDEEDEQILPKKFGKGLTEYVLRTGRAHLVSEHMDLELRQKGEVELVGAPAKIWLGVPLQIREKTIGVMTVQDYSNEFAYTEVEKGVLEMISFSVSRAIERKRTDDEIMNYIEQLKEINATKDRFFSFISHDLRGPFSSLLGFSEMILEDFDSLEKGDIKRYIETINATSKNLYNLLNNLLQFSRFQTGRIQFNPAEINIRELIHKNIELLKGNAIKKDIAICCDSVCDCTVFVDDEMISSVLQNLMTNAVKFTNRGGTIKIDAVRNNNGKEVEVTVKDSGIGMSSERLAKLFKIEMVQSTYGTEREVGTGLGLILTREFVEKNKGKIWVESERGEGTTFHFTLPLI